MKLFFLPMALLALVSCRHVSQSDLSHDEGRFANSVDPRQWTEINDETYGARNQPTPVLAAHNPMTLRLQAWADLMRDEILKTTPELKVAPRPLVRILLNKSANAYVDAQKVCVRYPITYSKKANLRADTFLLLKRTGPSTTKAIEPCTTFEGTAEEARDYLQSYFRGLKDCQFSLEENQIFVNRACLERTTYINLGGAQTSRIENIITVHAGAITEFSETEIVSTLAHELSHYYMAHGAPNAYLYNYYYRSGATLSPKKPEPIPAADRLPEDGFYTIEQEADDMALEMLYRLGLDPLASMTKPLKYLLIQNAKNYESCKDAYAQGFPSPIPLGSIDDLHHDSCYRAYNSFREMKAHAGYFDSIRRLSPVVIDPVVTWDQAVQGLRDHVLREYSIQL